MLVAACASQPKPEPEIASSANHGGYALGYTAALTSTMSDLNDRQITARKAIESMNGFPAALKDPPWQHVIEIDRAADEDGKGYAYVERIRQVDGAHEFYESEKDELNKRIGGAVTYVVKQKGCDVDASGAATNALKEGVDKQLQKELHDASESSALIERYRTLLGKQNIAEIEKQADTIAFASYLVHVEIVEEKVRLKRLVAEADKVKSTADDFIKAENDFQSEKGVTAGDKKASQDRIADMNKMKASVDAALQQANALIPQLDDQIAKIQKEYEDALATLKDRLGDKAKK